MMMMMMMMLCTGVTSSPSSSAAYLTVEPRSSVARLGDRLSLYCAASSTSTSTSSRPASPVSESHSDVTITWTHNGQPLDNQSSSSSSSSSRVDIRSFSGADEGLYQCIANNAVGSVISRPATLVLARNIFFSHVPASGVVLVSAA